MAAESPIPRLILGSHIHTGYDIRSGRMHTIARHRAALAFRYGDELIFGRHHPSHRRCIVKEQHYRRSLKQAGFIPAIRRSEALDESCGELLELPNDKAWIHFVQEVLPQLRDQGWEIEIRPDFFFDLTPIQDWYIHIDENSDDRWFDIDIGVHIDGQRMSLLPAITELIRRNPSLLDPKVIARHNDEEWLTLRLEPSRSTRIAFPFGRLKPILNTLSAFYTGTVDTLKTLRLHRMDATRLQPLNDEHFAWNDTAAKLRDFAFQLETPPTKTTPPKGLHATLRPYQLQGLRWLQTLGELGCGGILADDMGLGKTLQSLAHILLEKEAGRLTLPAMIVMPTSLIGNWQDEIKRFAPSLSVLALHGAQRDQNFVRIERYDVILTTYALLPRDQQALYRHRFHILILDEAHNIKNASTKAAHVARRLKAQQRICLTGTPMENNLGELWSLFHFLMPGWLGDLRQFNQEYRFPIEKNGDQNRLKQLAKRIHPFLLRRTKSQVASELPPKNEIVQYVELTESQRRLYETVRLALDKKVRSEIAQRGLARSQIIILEALLKLRQICCDIRLLNKHLTDIDDSSGKLSLLLGMLDELIAENHRILLFSQFTSMLSLIEQALQERQIPYVLLTGRTRDRQTPVKRFQNEEVPIFLISLKAGGVGLNLTAADTVIHFDPWWNPAVERQASDRAHRIGQNKPLFIYKLIARGTVEERIQQMQKDKAALAENLLDGQITEGIRFDEADIETLFSPMIQ